VIKGANFDNLETVGLKIQRGDYEQYAFCNVTHADANQILCFKLMFREKGTYSTFVVPDMDKTQLIKGVLKIKVEQFVQAPYSYPLPATIGLD